VFRLICNHISQQHKFKNLAAVVKTRITGGVRDLAGATPLPLHE